MLDMIMNPNDGFGCGRSVVWEIKALKISQEVKESCPCIDYCTLIISMIPVVKDGVNLLKCKIRCPDCNNKFVKTSEILTEKFLKFYGK